MMAANIYGQIAIAVTVAIFGILEILITRLTDRNMKNGNTMMPNNQFRDLVREMRDAQREYFRTRSHFVLQRSKELEKRVDEELKADPRKAPKNPTLF